MSKRSKKRLQPTAATAIMEPLRLKLTVRQLMPTTSMAIEHEVRPSWKISCG